MIGLEALRDEISASNLTSALKLNLLTMSLPRYLWRVTASLPGMPVFELLLDATDLLQGKLVRCLVRHDPKLCDQISYCLSLSKEVLPDTLRPTIKAFHDARSTPARPDARWLARRAVRERTQVDQAARGAAGSRAIEGVTPILPSQREWSAE